MIRPEAIQRRPWLAQAASRSRVTPCSRGGISLGVHGPATVRERLREAIKMHNVGHLMELCQFGHLDKERTRKNTELLAKEVMPHLRERWSDWEDH